MAAGENFTLVPNQVVPLEPVYNNVSPQSETMKKEYLNLSSTPTERFKLTFRVLTTTEKNTLWTHFKDNSGGYYPFSWTSVPSYIAAAAMTGRWVEGSLSIEPVGGMFWKIEIVFEKAVT